MSVCIWVYVFLSVLCFILSLFGSSSSACITTPQMAFGLGIYDMQHCIENCFVNFELAFSVSAFTRSGTLFPCGSVDYLD